MTLKSTARRGGGGGAARLRAGGDALRAGARRDGRPVLPRGVLDGGRGLHAVRARPGRLSALRVLHSKSFLYGAFVWARRVLSRQNGDFRPGQVRRADGCLAVLLQRLRAARQPALRAVVRLGLYPIVTSQYSSTTLYTRFPIIFSSCFAKVTIGFIPRFDAMESRETYRGTQSDFHTHVHDLPPQVRMPASRAAWCRSSIIISRGRPIPTAQPAAYDAFGVFGTALQEKIGVCHPSSLKMVPKTPNAS
jgi:hypothetical protein